MAKKIPVREAHAPLTANPFGALDAAGLPPGPREVSAETAAPDAAPSSAPSPQRPGKIVLRREKSGRGGKAVVVVSGFSDEHDDARIDALAREARRACGCGGTRRGREIELQGDDPARAREFFSRLGYRVAGV